MEKDLTQLSDFIISYMAPMQCGEEYRAEAARRIKEREGK